MVDFFSKLFSTAIAKWGKPRPTYFILILLWGGCLLSLSFGIIGYLMIVLNRINEVFDSIFVFIIGIPVSTAIVFFCTIPVLIILNRIFYHIINPLYQLFVVDLLVMLLTMKVK